jgi:hypothetical protein
LATRLILDQKSSGSRPDGTTSKSTTYEIFRKWFFVCCQVLARFWGGFMIIGGEKKEVGGKNGKANAYYLPTPE